jgi:hypothetical protein
MPPYFYRRKHMSQNKYFVAKILSLLVLIVGIPLQIFPFIYHWFWNGIETFNKIKLGAMPSTTGANMTPSLPLLASAIIVDSISMILFLFGCIYLIKLLNCYCRGELFSENIVRIYKYLLRIAFIWTCYVPFNRVLLGLITTLNNDPGYRMLHVSFTGNDIIHIFIVGSFLVMNTIMQEAYRLKQEQDLTV